MPTERGYEVRLLETWPPDSVTVNGENVAYNPEPDASQGWRYDGDSLTTFIRIPRKSVTGEIELSVRISPEKAARVALLDGAVGRLARIRRLFQELNNSGPESLLRLATAGRRITLKPETALSELAGYDSAKAAMAGDLSRTSDNAWSLLWTLQVSESAKKVDAPETPCP